MLLTLDFETAYGIHPITKENITLSKMTTEEYIRHPLFKAHMVGLKFGDAPAYYVYGDGEIRAALGAIDWANTSCLVHHGQFDGAILNWIYGHRPAFWLDTLAMANALFPWASSSLANLCKLLNLEDKGKELVQSKDKWELPPEIIATLGGYCCKDVELTYQAFFAMKEHFPMMELRLIDLTTRMFSEPVWEADRGLLLGEYRNELRTKRQFMRQAQAEQADLMSNDKFALLLESLGVEPPTKISTKTGKVAYAFAKSDEEFKVLLDHPDPRVQALVEARISVKSTIKQTRTKRLYKISKRGRVPVYLRYYGAHSGRWCLTGDTEIIVLRDSFVRRILLPDLLPYDLVWDGEEFVPHGGLVCRGEREVITHDGITGTRGHKVFVEAEALAVELSRAKERGYPLKIAHPPEQRRFAGTANALCRDTVEQTKGTF